MFTNTKLAKSVRLACAFGAAAAAFSVQSVNAQETPDEEEAQVTERISVTGSRIKRVDMESVSPVTVITFEDIELSGDTTVADVMRNSSVNSFGSFRGQSGYGAGAGASSEVNLRGLGSGATLVLVDGRRLPGVGYDGGSTADLSMIPMAIVERIEILRDGASAVYGSDAIAGVINIITKKDVEGVNLTFSYEQPGVEGGTVRRYSFSAGATSDRGSVVVIAEHENRDQVEDTAVTGSFSQGLFGDYYYGDYSSFSPVARFQVSDDSAGSLDGTYATNAELCGEVPDTSYEDGYCGYYYGNVTWLYGASKKDSIMTKVSYDLTDDIVFKGRFSGIQTSTQTRYAPTPVSTTTITIDKDNAMNPFGYDGLVRYRTATKGTRDTFTDKTTMEAVLGLEGLVSFSDYDFDWQLYYQRTNAKEVSANTNLVNDEKFQQLIDDELVDLWNVQGLSYDDWLAYNDAALDTVMHTGYYQVSQLRDIVDGNIGGEIFNAGEFSVSLVVGFEYSNLDFTQMSDPESGLGIISGGSGGDDVFATRERQSYYTEVAVAMPFNIELSAALRYDGYEMEGDTGDQFEKAEFSDTVPKLGISWRPIDDLLVRASWGEAFRAPTMSQMFASRSFGFPGAYDPYYCDTLGNATSDTNYCNPSQQHLTWNGGNPELQPETSESLTLGVVYNLTDDLSLELSYYDYDYVDKIESVSLTDILSVDLDGTSPNVYRLSNGQIDYVVSGYANLNSVKTNGFDVTLGYDLETGYGDIGVNFEMSKVLEYSEEGTDLAGELFYPDMRGNLTLDWSKEDFTASWRILYIGEHGDSLYAGYKYPDSYMKHNITAGYVLNENFRVTVGINNLTNEFEAYYPGGWRGFDDYNFDPLGRTYYLRLQADF